MKPACFEFWLKKEKWNFRELVFLIRGYEPIPSSEVDDELAFELRDALSEMKKHAEAFWEDRRLVPPLNFGGHQNPLMWIYDSRALLQWAETLTGIKIPPEFSPLLKSDEKKTETQKDRKTPKRKKDNMLLMMGAMSDLLKLDLTHPHTAAKKLLIKMQTKNIKGPGEETMAKRFVEILEVRQHKNSS